MIFKSDRADRLEALCKEYQKEIVRLEAKRNEFTFVPAPQSAEDQKEYARVLSELVKNPFYLFYLSKLRTSIIDDFEANGNEKAEYYRGKLAAIGMIIEDSRNALRHFVSMTSGPTVKDGE